MAETTDDSLRVMIASNTTEQVEVTVIAMSPSGIFAGQVVEDTLRDGALTVNIEGVIRESGTWRIEVIIMENPKTLASSTVCTVVRTVDPLSAAGFWEKFQRFFGLGAQTLVIGLIAFIATALALRPATDDMRKRRRLAYVLLGGLLVVLFLLA